MDIGQTVKIYRTAAKISQKDMAARLSISGSYLSLIESGEREITVSLLKIIARELGLPISAFFIDSTPTESINPKLQELTEAISQLSGHLLKLGNSGKQEIDND